MDWVDQWKCRLLLPDAKGTVDERALLDLALMVSSEHWWCAA